MLIPFRFRMAVGKNQRRTVGVHAAGQFGECGASAVGRRRIHVERGVIVAVRMLIGNQPAIAGAGRVEVARFLGVVEGRHLAVAAVANPKPFGAIANRSVHGATADAIFPTLLTST